MQLPLSLWYLTKRTMKTYMYDLSIYGLPGLFKTKMKNTIKKSKWKGKWKSPCTQFSPALLPAFAHWPTPGDKKTCPALSSPWSPYKSVNATNLYWLSQMIFFIKASRTWTSFPYTVHTTIIKSTNLLELSLPRTSIFASAGILYPQPSSFGKSLDLRGECFPFYSIK